MIRVILQTIPPVMRRLLCKEMSYVARELELWPEMIRERLGLVELSRPEPALGLPPNDMDAT